MGESIKIKKINLNDVQKLREIAKQTFFDTFSPHNTEKNMQKYLDEGFTTEKLTKELKNENSEFYFAMSNDEVIGYLKVNFGEAQTELQDNDSLEIERIYVSKDFHGKKVGQILYEKALEIADTNGTEYIWLGVWEKNPRAIQFYIKNGFVEFSKHIFKFGDEEQTDIMMRLKMKNS